MKNTIKQTIDAQWRFFVSIPAMAWQIIFLFIPLFILFISSFLIRDGRSLVFTFEHYHSIFSLSCLYVILRSLMLAFLNASLCLCIAYPVAYFLAIRVTRYKNFALFFLTLPFWINFLVHVYSWFFILDRNGLLNAFLIKLGIIHEPLHILNTVGAIMIVMFHGYLPFMIMPIYTVLEKLDKRLIEASLDLGATKLYTLFSIIMPLSFSGVLAGFMLVYVLTFGDFVIPTLVGGSKTLFVGTIISDYFLFVGNFAQGAAFTFVSAICLLAALYMQYIILRFLIKKK